MSIFVEEEDGFRILLPALIALFEEIVESRFTAVSPKCSVIDLFRIKFDTVFYKGILVCLNSFDREILVFDSCQMVYVTAAVNGYNVLNDISERSRFIIEYIDKSVFFASDVNDGKFCCRKPFHETAVGMAIHRLIDLYDAVKIIEIGKFYCYDIALIVKMELAVDLAAV